MNKHLIFLKENKCPHCREKGQIEVYGMDDIEVYHCDKCDNTWTYDRNNEELTSN